ncbi:MAG: lycopene cyclase domain-containing protein [Ignavibacteria bacterium]
MNLDKFLYLSVDIGCFILTFFLSFVPKFRLIKYFKVVFKGIFTVASGFILWDVIFTKLKVWSFADEYTLGLRIFDLPIEEILFFIAIPYSCIFTYYSLKQFVTFKSTAFIYFFSIVLSIILGIISIYNVPKLYTSVTLSLTGLIILWLSLIKWKFLFQLYVTYLIILLPFFIVNGILTGGIGKTVVSYNFIYNSGIRLITIPVEDVFYGFLLCALNIFLFERELNRTK